MATPGLQTVKEFDTVLLRSRHHTAEPRPSLRRIAMMTFGDRKRHLVCRLAPTVSRLKERTVHSLLPSHKVTRGRLDEAFGIPDTDMAKT